MTAHSIVSNQQGLSPFNHLPSLEKTSVNHFDLTYSDSSSSTSGDDVEEQKPSAAPDHGPGGSFVSGYSVIAKSMLGSGMITLASACAQTGWILGFALLVASACAALFTLHLLSDLACSKITMQSCGTKMSVAPVTFFALISSIFPRLSLVVDVSIAMKAFLACTAYLIMSGDMIGSILSPPTASGATGEYYDLARSLTKVTLLLLLSPLCFCKNITKTSFSNILGLLCWMYVAVIAVVYSSVCLGRSPPGAVHRLSPTTFVSVMAKLPVFIFAFACQQNLFPVICETKSVEKRSTTKYFDQIAACATGTGLLVFTLVMAFPYFTFGKTVTANFLENIALNEGSDNKFVIMAKLCAAVSVCLTLPLQVHPLRRSLRSLIFGAVQFESERQDTRVRYLLTGVPLLLVLTAALLISKLGLVMSVAGLVGGNTVSFFVPSMLYVYEHRVRRKSLKYYGALLVLAVSISIYPICLTCIVVDAATK